MSTTTLPPEIPTGTPSQPEVMARAQGENFPVASWVLGHRLRGDLLAVYGFARLADELGDAAVGDKLLLLDWLERELDAVFAGGRPEHPVMRTLADTVQECGLPPHPFRRLIEANRLDQRKTRYATFDELLEYCRLSAAPVGELVLHVFGTPSPEQVRLSDRICAALQVTEHLQDVAEDYRRGRVYIPAQDLARFGCEERDLVAAAASPALRALVAFEVGRARSLLDAGAPLCLTVAPRPRLAVAAFIAGGRAALCGIEAAGYDVLGRRTGRPHGPFARAFLRAVRGR